MGDRLATIDMGRKFGELGLQLTQCGLGRGLPPYQVCEESCQLLKLLYILVWGV